VAVSLVTCLLFVAALRPGTTLATGGSGDPPACESAFRVARAFRQAADTIASVTGDTSDHSRLATALIDLTIVVCANADEWQAAAAAHPGLLDQVDPPTVLAARCADPTAELATTAACADPGGPAPEPDLVARPRLQPRVPGAQRTRTYPIRGSSPDELFTQMQLNGSRLCPSHAVACVNIQPNIRPLVTTGSDCRVIGIQASLSTVANVPRWARPARVVRELVPWWRKVATRIGRHEQRHVRIAEQHLARLRRDIIGKPCSALNAVIGRWSKDLSQAQARFDAKELERPWPPYDGPVP
jgi:predicted secreted Zn-dependent protease